MLRRLPGVNRLKLTRLSQTFILRTERLPAILIMGSCVSHIPCSKITLKIAADQSHTGASFMEIRDLLTYLAFMILLGLFTLGVYTQNSFHLHNALANSFIHQPYYCGDERTNIFNVSSIDELWCYLKYRFIVALNDHPFWGEIGTNNETFLLKQPRIRQVRVIEEDCIIPAANHGCFAEFSTNTEDRSPFHLGNGTAWVYNPPEQMGDIWFKGKFSYYNAAGYYFMLSNASQLEFYEENEWIDEQTRALFIDFTLYNININLFCVCQIMFELPPSGGISPSFLFSTIKIIRYNDAYDHRILACEITFAVFCIYYSIELFHECVYFKRRVYQMFDMWVDSFILGLSWASVWVLIYRYIASLRISQSDGIRGMQELPDYQQLKYVHLMTERLTAVTLFGGFLKLYRFLHLDTINQIYTTLQHCVKDMIGFSCLFGIILLAYAELGTLLFSNFVESYRSLDESCFTLLRIIMGEFHYQEITRVLSLIGPVYIVTFVMFVVFLLLNMFLAIINATFSVVSSTVKVTRKSEYGPFLKHCLYLCSNRFQPKPAEETARPMTNSDKIIQLMKRSGFSELEIETFFSRYTVDNDREIPDQVFQRVVHSNVGTQHLVKLRSGTNLAKQLVKDVIKKKEFFLDKVGHLMRR